MTHELIRRARAGLTQVIEPADALGVIASKAWGPLRLLDIIQGDTPSQHDWKALISQDPADQQLARKHQHKLGEAIERWRRRSSYLKPDAALRYITRLGGRFLIPEDTNWPVALADLDITEPLGLWMVGEPTIPNTNQVLGLVGSREATAYGEAATAMLAEKARSMGVTVLSGGAYGIDAHAHRCALDTAGRGLPTIAVLAGGLDRFYPAGNVELLRQIVADGIVLSEMPPGMRPNRYRFLNRNRVIAALASTTIVVEARYRSGALNTANHALDLGRMVGAVPGPINVPSSAGCHRLMKETPALLIDDAADLEAFFDSSRPAIATGPAEEHSREYDGLEVHELLIYDALPVQGRTSIGHLGEITGLSIPMIAGTLNKLERQNLAEHVEDGWRKHRNTRAA